MAEKTNKDDKQRGLSEEVRAGDASTKERFSRRRLIQALAAGGVVTSAKLVPDNWKKPLVESVTLPAHAQTTGVETEAKRCRLGNNTATDPVSTEPETLYERVVDSLSEFVVPQALAQDGCETDSCRFLTGCFWIEFDCGSKHGTLYATGESFEDDVSSDSDSFVYKKRFTSGQKEALGACDEYPFFTVTIHSDTNATLEFDNCPRFQGQIELVKNPTCVEGETM